MQKEPEITWTVPLERANMILSVLGKQPFEAVAETIMDLRMQAGSQIQRFQQEQNAAGLPPPAPGSRPNGDARPDA